MKKFKICLMSLLSIPLMHVVAHAETTEELQGQLHDNETMVTTEDGIVSSLEDARSRWLNVRQRSGYACSQLIEMPRCWGYIWCADVGSCKSVNKTRLNRIDSAKRFRDIYAAAVVRDRALLKDRGGEVVVLPPENGFATVIEIPTRPVRTIHEIPDDATALHLSRDLRIRDPNFAPGSTKASEMKGLCTYSFYGSSSANVSVTGGEGSVPLEMTYRNPKDRKLSGADCSELPAPVKNECVSATTNNGTYDFLPGVILQARDTGDSKALVIQGASSDVVSCLREYGYNPPDIKVRKEYKKTTELIDNKNATN